jgi:hypothetical protein
MESPWKKFLDTVLKDDFEKLLKTYYEMRILFQTNNVKNSDLEKGEGITSEGYRMRDKILNYLTHIVGTLRKYGLIENEEEFNDYLKQELLKIDLETPLKD